MFFIISLLGLVSDVSNCWARLKTSIFVPRHPGFVYRASGRNKGQYYAYAGATLPLTGTELSFEPFIDVFVARQKYFIKDGVGNVLPAYFSVYTAAFGVTKTIDHLSLSLSAGPALQSYTEKYSYQDQGQTVLEK